jgi:hypothetical protein
VFTGFLIDSTRNNPEAIMTRVGIVIVMLAAIAGGASAQEQRLPDVAGDIRLRQPDAPAVLVDLTQPGRPGPNEATTGRNLIALGERMLVHIDTVSELLAAAKFSDEFFSTEWRERMLDACFAVDNDGRSLRGAKPESRYAVGHAAMVDGVRDASEAADLISSSIEQDRPLYAAAYDWIATAQVSLHRGLDEARRAFDAVQNEAEAPLEDWTIALDAITALCESRTTPELSYDDCIALQEDAYNAITGRFSASVRLDETTFNKIRNQCRRSSPGDYAARNRCELWRIGTEASATGDL